MSSSSNNNSYFDTDNIIAREHVHNFHNLPFHIYFTSPYSPLPPHLTSLNLEAFFRQVPAPSVPVPNSPPPQRLILVATEYHYRYIIDRRPARPTLIQYSSDSPPPLVRVVQPPSYDSVPASPLAMDRQA